MTNGNDTLIFSLYLYCISHQPQYTYIYIEHYILGFNIKTQPAYLIR